MTVDLSSKYLGLHLPHPIVASAGPLTGHVDTLVQLAEAGAAAVVLPSLFEEDAERAMSLALAVSGIQGPGHAEDATTGLRSVSSLDIAQHHINLVHAARAAVHIPVIASLNGSTTGGWVRLASALSAAGADALELNIYRVIADSDETAASVERSMLELVEAVRAKISIPLAIKVGPFFTAFPAFARRLVGAGADALVLFNRLYEPDIDLDDLEVRPSMQLSTSADLRLPLRWTALLHGTIDADLAFSGGIHRPDDVVKALLAGASVVMTTSSLLRNGAGHLSVLREGLRDWLQQHDYESVRQLRGSMAVGSIADPDAYERANYLEAIQTASRRYGG